MEVGVNVLGFAGGPNGEGHPWKKWGAVPATEAGTPTLHSFAPRPNLFAWPGKADLTHIGDEIPKEISFLPFAVPPRKEGVRNKAADSSSASSTF